LWQSLVRLERWWHMEHHAPVDRAMPADQVTQFRALAHVTTQKATRSVSI